MTKRLSSVLAGDLVDWTGIGVTLKGSPSSNGSFDYYGNGVNHDTKMSYTCRLTGAGNGTFNHGCTQLGVAAAPGNFLFNSYTGAPFSSQTMGFNTITSTQVTVATGGSLAWSAVGVKN